MSWRIYDFQCDECDVVFEDLVEADVKEMECTECRTGIATRMMSAPLLGFMNDPYTKQEALKKRSLEHTRKQQKNGNLKHPSEYKFNLPK